MRNRLFLLICLFSLLGACEKHPSEYANEYNLADMNRVDMKMAEMVVESADEATSVQETEAVQRQVIKTGSIKFEIDDPEKTAEEIRNITRQYKGYISSENTFRYDTKKQMEMEIRVPAHTFDTVMTQVASLAVKIESKSADARDVTEEYIDLKTRLENKSKLEERYRELLSKTTNIKEILEIESALNQIRTEVETIEGRLKFVMDQVAMSTLFVSFYKTEKEGILFFREVGNGLSRGWDYFLYFLLFLVNSWPFLLLIGGIILFIRRRKLKRNRDNG